MCPSLMRLSNGDINESYCYSSVYDGGDYLLIGYYHSNGTTNILSANVIIKINKADILD